MTNGFWIGCNQVISLVGSLIVTAVFAHSLTEQSFGIYRYLVIIASFFSVLSLNSIGQSILQTTAQGKLGFFSTGMKYSFYSGFLSSLLALATSVYYFANDNFVLGIGCIFIAVFQGLITSYFNIFNFLNGQKRFKEAAGFQIIRVTIITIISLLTITFTQDLSILFFTYQAAQFITISVGYFYFKPSSDQPALSTEETNKYISFGVHQSIQSAIINGAQRLDAIVVFQHLGAPQLAVYSIALVIPDQIRGFIKNLSNLLFPKYVNYTPAQLRSSIPKRSFQLFLILILITFSYIALAPIMFSLLFPKYITGVLYSQLLALAIPASVFYIIQSALKSETNSVALYYIQLSSAVVRIILTLVLTYTLGIVGTIIAFVASSYIELSFYFIWLYLDRT